MCSTKFFSHIEYHIRKKYYCPKYAITLAWDKSFQVNQAVLIDLEDLPGWCPARCHAWCH